MELSAPESREGSSLVLRTFSGRILKYRHPFRAMLPVVVPGVVDAELPVRGVGTMNKAGLMRMGAMLAVLAVLAGVFAGMPYWTARAANKTIWGLVNECSVPGPSYLQNVIVTLTDAHTGTTLTNSTWRDGSFIFNNPPPGSYLLRFQIADHYTVDYPPTGALRFDGSIDVNRNVCLERMPTRNSSLAVLVVDQTSSAHMEDLTSRFPRTLRTENIASGVNTATGIANVSGHPVVRPGYTLTWSAPGSSFFLQEGSDYTWVDLFAGTVRILNSTVISSLQGGTGGKNLTVSYQFSGTTARLAYFPVLPGSTTVYKNDVVWTAGPDWTLNNDTGWLTINGNFIFGTDKVTVDYSSTGVVPQATVNLFNTTKKQVVASGLTDSSGFVTLSIWKSSSDLELQVSKAADTTYEPYAASIDTNAVNSTRVALVNGIPVFGHAFRAGGGPTISTNVVGFLYNTNMATPAFKKLIAAKVSGSLYVFYAEPGQNYRMVIDADGYQAADVPVSTNFVSQVEQNVVLSPSLKEQYLTYVSYNSSNWSMAVINRTLILRPDTTVPGLELPGIRSLGLQVDYTLGNKDGISWNAGEPGLFQTWLQSRGADYITTDGFLTTNGQAFNSSAIPYVVNTPEISPSALTPKGIFVNTTATYTLLAPPTVANGKATYLVNVTTPNDSNITQYKNRVVVVKLPTGYEMIQKRVTGSITTTGWTTITVDPGLAAGTSRIDMTIQKSANGTARVMAKEPAGKFYVLDDSLTNYTAVVAANKNISF